MLILELEMDTVQAEVLILTDDVIELRNQDSLTDLRLITVEEDIEGVILHLKLHFGFKYMILVHLTETITYNM